MSQGRVSVQRHRTLSAALATRGFFFVPTQESEILVPYSSWLGKGSAGRKKRIKRLRSCPASRKTALASSQLLPRFRAESCCSLHYQAKRHLPAAPPTEEEVPSCSLPLLSLQIRTGIIQLRTAKQLPVRPSEAQLSEWMQAGVSSGVAGAVSLLQTELCSGKGGTEAAPRNPHQRAGRSLLRQRPFIQARPGAST